MNAISKLKIAVLHKYTNQYDGSNRWMATLTRYDDGTIAAEWWLKNAQHQRIQTVPMNLELARKIDWRDHHYGYIRSEDSTVWRWQHKGDPAYHPIQLDGTAILADIQKLLLEDKS